MKTVDFNIVLCKKILWLIIGILLVLSGIFSVYLFIIESIDISINPGEFSVHPLYLFVGGLIAISFGISLIYEKYFGKKRILRKFRKRN